VVIYRNSHIVRRLSPPGAGRNEPGWIDESRRSSQAIHIGSMQDAHLVQHTVSFEDRPWLNDMDKKSPIEIAAEARRAASNNQARPPSLSL